MDKKQKQLFFDEIHKSNPNLEIIKYLLNYIEDINEKDENGENILFNVLETINDIKWKNENGDYMETSEEAIDLVQKTVPKIDLSIIKYLLELGADPNIPDNKGWRCLKEAVFTFRSDIFKLLLDYGADIEFKVDGSADFYEWVIDENEDFKNENNKIAVTEISKMIDFMNDIKQNK